MPYETECPKCGGLKVLDKKPVKVIELVCQHCGEIIKIDPKLDPKRSRKKDSE